MTRVSLTPAPSEVGIPVTTRRTARSATCVLMEICLTKKVLPRIWWEKLRLQAPRARRTRGACSLSFSHHIRDRKSTRLNSSHSQISYAVFCLKKKKEKKKPRKEKRKSHKQK